MAIDSDGDVGVFEMKKTLSLEISDFDDEYGSITDRDYRLTRKGESMNETKYTATPLDVKPMTKKQLKAQEEAVEDSILDNAIAALVGDTEE